MIEEADEYRKDWLVEIMNFKKNKKPKSAEKKEQKKVFLKTCRIFFLFFLGGGGGGEGGGGRGGGGASREKLMMLFESKIFSTKSKWSGILNPDHSKLKILTYNHMLQRLPIAHLQMNTGNYSESWLNQIRQIVYSLHQSKQITKKVYNNMIKSIQLRS